MSDFEGFIVQAGEPGLLTEETARQAAQATLLALEVYPRAKVTWWVPGYEDDPRALWEIPEVAEQIRRCARFAGWVDGYHLPRQSLVDDLVVLLVQCECFPNGHPYTVVLTP
jgi:hypothetical protein